MNTHPAESLRIIYLEDKPRDRELVAETLAAEGLSCELIHAATRDEFESALAQRNIAVILSDYTVPAYSGTEALEAARKLRPETPFIYLSGTIGEERAVESLRSGATDYVLKDNLKRLAPAVRRALREAAEHESRKHLEMQLQQAQKMEAIGRLAGGVAHDFNNLLAVIRGHADLLLLDPAQHSAETIDSLRQIVATAERAASLPRQLLAFSRQQIMQSRPFNINEAIVNLTRMLKRIIGDAMKLECDYAPIPLFIEGDIGMIEQVLVNLVINARDALPSGGTVRISTERITIGTGRAGAHPEARAGEFVRLSVADNGTGILPELLPRIFDPFFTTKDPGKGTGLGLSIAYGIIRQHNGWIEVHSQPGAGTRFDLHLPAIPTPAPPSPSPGLQAGLKGGSERILVVEDEVNILAMTRQLLEAFGYRVWTAVSADEALEIWRSHTSEVSLLLTDVVMAGSMSGLELAEQLHREKPDLKVIVMSGYSADIAVGGKETITRLGGVFLQKPCPSRTILETVRKCLDRGGVMRDASHHASRFP